MLIQLRCNCIGHMIVVNLRSRDSVTKRAQAPIASPD